MARQKLTHAYYAFAFYSRREGHLYEVFLVLTKKKDASYLRTGVKGCSKIKRVLAKMRLILDEMCRLYGKFASYLRRVLCKTRLIFPRINGPSVYASLEAVDTKKMNQIA